MSRQAPLLPARRTMGSLYSDIPCWLHGVPAGLKLALLVVLGLVLFWLQSPTAFAVAGALALLLWLSLGAATRPARRLMVSVLVASGLVALFQLWMGQPDIAVSATLRLACTSCLGVALTVTTRPAALLEVLERLLQPLRVLGLSPERVALQLGLMLRFVEHFFVQWKKLDEAWRLRTGRSGGWRLIAPLTVQMLQTTRRVADALFARLGR
jgi:cobalt transport protein